MRGLLHHFKGRWVAGQFPRAWHCYFADMRNTEPELHPGCDHSARQAREATELCVRKPNAKKNVAKLLRSFSELHAIDDPIDGHEIGGIERLMVTDKLIVN